ncbi:unnamed protein product [Pseudo-nitzschia multistriata]|uniref:AAA+ ATPase domain-containing protein n=1 Tax=Pseudo-nitzschia multistriata TaxID=183589 RepID=A0A448ZEY6_9STRA|nr:unnamed protein product [Pseudo-nitzschia multistriata]
MTKDSGMNRAKLFLVLTILLLSTQPSDGEPFLVSSQSALPCDSGLFRFGAAQSNGNYSRRTSIHRGQYSLVSDRRQRQRYFARSSNGIRMRSLLSRIGSMLGSKESLNAKTQNFRFFASTSQHVRPDRSIPSALTSEDAFSSQSMVHGKIRKRPRWLRFPKVTSDQIRKFSSVVQYTAIAVICFELFFVLKDVFDEVLNDLQDLENRDAHSRKTNSGSGDFGNNRKVLSKHSVKKIVDWLEQKGADRLPPPSVAPAWTLAMAQELYKCNSLSLAGVERILLQITNAEAEFLGSCLLSSDNMADVNDDIGGLFAAKSAYHQLLVSSLSAWRDSCDDPSVNRNSSPYTKFVAKGNSNNGMVLWGPPGSGKSLLLRAIAKSSGLPTLMVTPALMQRTKSLEVLFSLIETLGSCAVVLDDLDGLFLVPQGNENASTRNFRSEWLQRWDDVSARPSSSDGRGLSKRCVLTVAATNRPWDVDIAAWRRLPNRIYIGLPNAEDRCDMLKKWSRDLPPIDDSVLQELVGATEGYLPSDLYQVLHYACQVGPVARRDKQLTIEDVRVGLSGLMPSRYSSQYVQQLQEFVGGGNGSAGRAQQQQQQQQQQGRQHGQQPPGGRQENDFMSSIEALPYREEGYCWQTPGGNYYQFQIPVDSQVLEAIQTILLHRFEWGPGEEEWDASDCYDEEEDDDYDGL